jgi:hypothetical protein
MATAATNLCVVIAGALRSISLCRLGQSLSGSQLIKQAFNTDLDKTGHASEPVRGDPDYSLTQLPAKTPPFVPGIGAPVSTKEDLDPTGQREGKSRGGALPRTMPKSML